MGRQFRRLMMHQGGNAMGFGGGDNPLHRFLIFGPVILVGPAQGNAEVVGADENAVDARHLQDFSEVVHCRHAFNADNGDGVAIALFQIVPGGGADLLSGIHQPPHRRAFQRPPLGRRDDFLDFRHRFAVGREDPLGAGVQGHRYIVGRGYRDADNGDYPGAATGRQVIGHFGPAAGAVFGVKDNIIQANPFQSRRPPGIAPVGYHRPIDPAAGLQGSFQFRSVHTPS